MGFDFTECSCNTECDYLHLTMSCKETTRHREILHQNLRQIEKQYQLKEHCLQVADENKLVREDEHYWVITTTGITSKPPPHVNSEQSLEILYNIQQSVAKFIEACMQEFNTSIRKL